MSFIVSRQEQLELADGSTYIANVDCGNFEVKEAADLFARRYGLAVREVATIPFNERETRRFLEQRILSEIPHFRPKAPVVVTVPTTRTRRPGGDIAAKARARRLRLSRMTQGSCLEGPENE